MYSHIQNLKIPGTKKEYDYLRRYLARDDVYSPGKIIQENKKAVACDGLVKTELF